jgi:hypothetical protein
VWGSLASPREPAARPWLDLLADEAEPRVLTATAPELVVWSSLWPDRPDDQIRFDLRPRPDGLQGCLLRWTLLTPDDLPDEGRLGRLRPRLNFLLYDRLLRSYSQ